MRWAIALLVVTQVVGCLGSMGGSGADVPQESSMELFSIERAPKDWIIAKVHTATQSIRADGCFSDFPAVVDVAALDEALRKHMPEVADRAELLAEQMSTLDCHQYIDIQYWKNTPEGGSLWHDTRWLIARAGVVELVRPADTGRDKELLATIPIGPAAKGGSEAGGGCSKDAECKGDHICRDGQCVPSRAATAAAPAAASGCTMDAQCKGDRVCQNDTCVSLVPAASAPAPAPADCGRDTDCKGDRVCRDGRCEAP